MVPTGRSELRSQDRHYDLRASSAGLWLIVKYQVGFGGANGTAANDAGGGGGGGAGGVPNT